MWKQLAILLVLVGAAQSAKALSVFPTATLGWWVNESDSVVRAVVTKAEFLPPARKGADSLIKFELEIHETLLGPDARTMTVYLDDGWDIYRSSSPGNAADKSEQLFFISVEPAAASHPDVAGNFLVQRLPFDVPTINLESNRLSEPLLTDDLRLLSTGREVLAEARLLVKMPRATDRCATIELPNETAARLSVSQGWIEVGLNAKTFEVARQWLRSPDPALQWSGAEVLVHEKTPQNIEALRRFAWRLPSFRGWEDKSRIRLLDRLSDWGVKDLPSRVHPAPVFNAHNWFAWLSLGGSILPVGIVFLWNYRGGIRAIRLAWWLATAGITVLGVRSYWSVDAGSWKGFDVAFERGIFYLTDERPSRKSEPFVFCQPADLLSLYSIPSFQSRNNDLFEPNELYFTPARDSSIAEHDAYVARGGWKARLQNHNWKISIWLLLSILLVPQLTAWFWRLRRNRRMKNLRGFPIQVR